ncbi:hypothetical protein INR75_13060 [Zunongwangia sp. SCSIO 43204]|nr:hypothetical protein [Zunongwangia sp. SCSIO 43204]UAB83132.1 hypothetical protein INR75_13060 [Zunongwangia sp. SCSIO 43204]
MKRVPENVRFVVLVMAICVIFGQETETQKRILIDMEYGGKDSVHWN